MTHPIQIIVLCGCDNCGTQNLQPGMMICDACLERSRRREIAQRPIAIQAEDGYKLYRLEDGTYGDGDMRFINFYDIPDWVEIPLDPKDPRCPKCGGQMEHHTSEAPNNAGSDAEWYQCPTCDHETEVS